MIFVDRSRVPVPSVLRSPQAEKERARIRELLRKEHLAQLRVRPAFHVGQSAKAALLDLFHGKCAYCESRLGSYVEADVEHFRPKAGATDLNGRTDAHHYAGHSLEWDNLLIVCARCNRQQHKLRGRFVGKGSLFPVRGERAPLLASVEECRSVEFTLLIDPCFDRPELELIFTRDGECRPNSVRGDITIEVLDLNREALVEARKEVWAEVQFALTASLTELRRSGESLAAAQLRELLSGRLPYTAAARAAFVEGARALHGLSDREAATLQALAEIDEPLRTVYLESAYRPRRASARVGSGHRPKTLASAPPSQFTGKTRLPPFARQHIRRVEIRNFKAIEHLDLDLPDAPRDVEDVGPATLLLGENACGKSTILEAIALTLLGTDLIDKLELDGADFIRRTDWEAPPGKGEPAEVAVHFAGTAEPVRLRIDPRSGRFRGERKPATIVLAYGPRRFFSDKRGRKPLPGNVPDNVFHVLTGIRPPSRG